MERLFAFFIDREALGQDVLAFFLARGTLGEELLAFFIALGTLVERTSAFFLARGTLGEGMLAFFQARGIDPRGRHDALPVRVAAYSVARQHGGDLLVASEPERGSTFTLFLASEAV